MPVKHHPSRLLDSDLTTLMQASFRHWDQAPTLFAWLVENVQAESIRRARERQCEPPEPMLLVVPCSWTDADLAKALSASAALTYGECSDSLGQFLDKLAGVIVAMAAARLITRGR